MAVVKSGTLKRLLLSPHEPPTTSNYPNASVPCVYAYYGVPSTPPPPRSPWKMGYGSRAIELLTRYYEGGLFSGTGAEESEESEETSDEETSGEENSSEEGSEEESGNDDGDDDDEKEGVGGGGAGKPKKKTPKKGLASERLTPRKKLPPLLVSAGDRRPERLHWLGSSFGVTGQLLRLWKRAGFKLVYLRQTTSDLTGGSVD